MNIKKIKTLGDLKSKGYHSLSIKDELRKNLLAAIRDGREVFQGIWGYEESVIPQLQRAILSRHDINLLGLRGQAKTRLARLMVELLDEYVPVIKGSDLNEDPFHPITRNSRQLLEQHGDDLEIDWLHRDERYAEKLATPDVTVADLIGDIDPIKAANLRLHYADDRVVHYGMIPRANRSIFVINELPDLQARIQVALFNILQEGDVQIRGFNLRLPLDMQFVFTANPEDYTNRGSMVTPLKDRIGSQILTHYPDSIEIAKKITAQESASIEEQNAHIHVPEIARDLLESIGFEARRSDMIDVKSGVSARLSISAFENLLSAAELRSLQTGDEKTSIRLSDFMATVPSITGKVELVYEGEQEGALGVALNLIDEAVKTSFTGLFPDVPKLERKEDESPYDEIIAWFFEQEGFELMDNESEENYRTKLDGIKPLHKLVSRYQPDLMEKDRYFVMELILWGLVALNKLKKKRFTQGIRFQDPYGSYISDL